MVISQEHLPALTEKEFALFRKIVRERSGIHLVEEKLCLLSNRLRRRVRALKLGGYEDYYHLLTKDDAASAEEMGHFLSAITTNETYFYRNEKLWNFFSTDLMQYLKTTFPQKEAAPRYNFWSCAASSGEEAYTMAISLRENLRGYDPKKTRIIGTDLSDRVLGLGKSGQYKDYALQRTPDQIKRKYFKQSKESKLWSLDDKVKKAVSFQKHDLRNPFTACRFHVAFLRNVLMYFDEDTKRQVLGSVTAALHPGAIMVIGDVDPLRHGDGLREDFGLIPMQPTVYRKQ